MGDARAKEKRTVTLYSKCGRLHDADDLSRSYSALLDNTSWNTMLANYVKYHCIDDARKMFDEMPQRDCISFTTMIMGPAQNGLPAEALSLFRDMVACGVKPNEVTLATMLSSTAHLCCGTLCSDDYVVVAGKMVHAVARKTRLDVFVLVGTNLVNLYSIASNLERSRAVFNEVPEKNTVTLNAMLNGYAKAGLIDSARDFHHLLENDN